MAASLGVLDVIRIYLILLFVRLGVFVTIITPTNKFTRRLGGELTLSCEFRASYFNHFDNPVLWLKTQHHETTEVNIQGTIKTPFVDTNRFRVKFTQTPPIYRFELFIAGLDKADNGNYTCEVRGDRSRILANITHELIVLAPADHVFITNTNQSGVEHAPSMLEYTEHEAGTIRCLSQGGYPAPDVEMTVGAIDIDEQLNWTYLPLFEGPVGLRTMSYVVERWSHTFHALPDYDGREILCTAVVPGLTAQATAVRITVNYLPKVFCGRSTAYLGQRNVTVSCLIAARPRVTAVTWLSENNGSEFDVMTSTAYWTTMRIINDTNVQAMLHISRADRRRFTRYRVVARNAIGTRHGFLHLNTMKPEIVSTKWPRYGPRTTTPSSGGDSSAPPGDRGSHYVFIISSASPITFHAPMHHHCLLPLLVTFWLTFYTPRLDLR